MPDHDTVAGQQIRIERWGPVGFLKSVSEVRSLLEHQAILHRSATSSGLASHPDPTLSTHLPRDRIKALRVTP
jgi:hypothetical protein